jgi:hypothetical protein
MEINRRQFGKSTVALLGFASLGGTVLLDGCTGSQVINEINVVLQQAAAVLAVAEPNAPWVAELKNAIAALMTAEQQWQNGGTVQVVIDVLNTIVAITAVIPITAVYSPLIDILVAGIEAVLAALPQSSNVGGIRAQPSGNPHIGKYAFPKHWYRSTPTASEFKSCWNAAAKANPQLATAVLK